MKLYDKNLKEVKFKHYFELEHFLNMSLKKEDILVRVFINANVEFFAERVSVYSDITDFVYKDRVIARISTTSIEKIILGTVYPEIYLKKE